MTCLQYEIMMNNFKKIKMENNSKILDIHNEEDDSSEDLKNKLLFEFSKEINLNDPVSSFEKKLLKNDAIKKLLKRDE